MNFICVVLLGRNSSMFYFIPSYPPTYLIRVALSPFMAFVPCDAIFKVWLNMNCWILVWNYEESNPLKIVQDDIQRFTKDTFDLIIIDTSRRHKQEASLFTEIRELAQVVLYYSNYESSHDGLLFFEIHLHNYDSNLLS